MARKTKYNLITNIETIEKINKKNSELLNDFVLYLKSVDRSEGTINGYINDIQIFFVWNLLNNNDKFFVDLTKREFSRFQNYLLNENGNSSSRIRRLKAALSSLSDYIENILDDEPEFKGFRNIVKKIENPVLEKVREKTIFSDEQLDCLLNQLIENKKYQEACVVALGMCSGARKSELLRFKVDYFKDENIIYDSLYKTPEKIKTKGRSSAGKKLVKFVLVNKFKPYLDLWLKEREELNIQNEYLFVSKKGEKWIQMKTSTLDSWSISFTKMVGVDFYFHSLRHYLCTHVSKLNIPDNVIKEFFGWDSISMVGIYSDLSPEDKFGDYFGEDGIKQVEKKTLKDL